MPLPIVQIDAFTAHRYAGNPAALMLLTTAQPASWMLAVAREMNPAETAFLTAEVDAFRLRWFTAHAEVDLCGHATLAAAHHLWEAGLLDASAEARFLTRSGLLTCRRDAPWIEMDFPLTPAQPSATPRDLAAMLGADVVTVQRSVFDLLVELPDAATVRRLQPDLTRLAEIDVCGVIVTAAADDRTADVVLRVFAPRAGRDRLTGYQASARGGYVNVSLQGDRVLLRGQAVTVLRGTLLFD